MLRPYTDARPSPIHLQVLPCDQAVRFQVPPTGRLDHLRGQRRRRCVAVPFPLLLQAREIVAQWVLVEARLALPGLITVGRPEAGRVGREDLVDHGQPVVGCRAELEFRGRDDDAGRARVASPRLVQREARLSQSLGGSRTQRRHQVGERHVLVVALLGLRGRREDRGCDPCPRHEPGGTGLARQRAGLAVLGPRRSRDVSPHDALERDGPGTTYQHGAARKGRAERFEAREPLRNLVRVGREEVVRDDGREPPEPEGAELGEHRSLVRHGLAHHHVERAHPIARDQEQRVPVDFVHLADLAAPDEGQGEPAGDQRHRHTVTSAVAAALGGGATASIRWSTGGTTCCRNSSTWRGARPTYPAGSSSSGRTATLTGWNAGSRASRSSTSFAAPCSATAWATARLWGRITSCSRWRAPPALTPRISRRSVASRGSCAATWRAITGSRTSSPAGTLVASTRNASLARNASGSTRRRFALSSSVRSSHWAAAVCQAFPSSSITKRARLVIRSARMGFRLYAMAEEPTCSLSNGSSISPSCASSPTSGANFADGASVPESAPTNWGSSLRVYVWPVTGKTLVNPILRATRASSSRTFSSAPSNNSRKLACVPVVPFTPRNWNVSSRWSSSSASSRNSCIHSVTRFPTVVSCAGWKWV